MADPRYIRSVLPQFPQPTRPILSYDINPDPPSPEDKTNIKSNSDTSTREFVQEFHSTSEFVQEFHSTSEFVQEFHYPEVLELPKNTQNQTCDVQPPPECYPQFSESATSSSSSSSGGRIHLSPSTGKTPKGEKEAVDELLLILVECMDELNTRSREALLRKFFSEIESEERLERFIVERLKQSRVKSISDLCEKLPASVRGQINSDGSNVLPTISESEDFDYDDDDDYGTTTRSLHESVEELSQKLERFKVRTLQIGGNDDKDEELK